jgi:hypothetical protein
MYVSWRSVLDIVAEMGRVAWSLRAAESRHR